MRFKKRLVIEDIRLPVNKNYGNHGRIFRGGGGGGGLGGGGGVQTPPGSGKHPPEYVETPQKNWNPPRNFTDFQYIPNYS